ncbi:SurA N-terminal domain-containing protein [Povalibacter sp.]|uniref:SurA N-terminal domain-containing protein n=1 Tax=Povalibacter sp. TaxID=1962978 RepID=UPI002F402339
MLQTIRDKASGWVATIFLGAIAVVFVFWGVDFQSGATSVAAKVDGTKIPAETVRRAWQQRQSQLQQMMRADLPPEMVKSQQQAILDEQIRTTLLTQRAEELGYRVSDEELAKRIFEFPELQVDGKFSRDRYAMLLRQQGRTEPQFEAELRSSLAIVQLQSGVMQSAFVAPYEADRRFALEKQERELDYALIPTSDFSGQANITDEQIQSWYDSHKDDYLLPETVDLQYVQLTRAKAESAVTVGEAELKDYYEQVKEKYESPERRHARHILITATDGLDDAAASKKAAELAAQAKAGGDFAELAKKNSKDPGSAVQGGDLGWAQRGMFVGPFEDALFGMQQGEIRGPIKTQFGYHIIRLEGIESGHLRPFDEVRPELEAEYRKDRSQSIFYDESQKLADLAFSSLTELDSVAKQLDLPVKTIPGFSRGGGGELGDDPGVIEAAFSDEVLQQGRNSPLVALGEDRALVLRVANHKPAEPRPLADVRAQIDAQLRVQAARDAANAKAAGVLAKLQESGSWTSVSGELTPVGKRYVTRQDTIAPAAVVRAAFQTASTNVSEEKPYFGTTTTDDGNVAVFSLSGIRPGNPASESASDRNARLRRGEQQTGNEEFAAYVGEAERRAKIVRNDKVFE